MPEGTVSSCHASLCSGKQRQWGVASAGVRPMRSRKGNGLDEGSSNKTAVLMIALTQEEDFVVFLSSHVELQRSLKSNSHCQPETKHWWNIVTLLICLYCSQHSFHPFDLCLWSSLYVPFHDQMMLNTTPFETAVHSATGWCRSVWIITLMHNKKGRIQ